jgi:hypothetical protein
MRFAGDIFFQKGSKPANRKGGVLGYKNQQEETTFSTPTSTTPTSTTPTSTTPTSTTPTSTTPTSTTPTSTTPTSTTPTFSSPASARVNPNIDYADLPIFKAISPNTGNIPSFTNDENLPSLAATQDKPKDSDNANGQPTPFGNYVPEVADETDNLPEEKTPALPQLIRMERYYNPTSASHFFTADPSKEDLTFSNNVPCLYVFNQRYYVRTLILRYLDIPREGIIARPSCICKSCINPYHFSYRFGKNSKLTGGDVQMLLAFMGQGAGVSQAAKALKVHRSTIYRKLKNEHFSVGSENNRHRAG